RARTVRRADHRDAGHAGARPRPARGPRPVSPPGVQRRLAAILSADVKGYSRLMGEDEVATVRTLTAYREVMAALIRERHGRVVDASGDNVLAEFASVVDALVWAVEHQREFKSWNGELTAPRSLELSITCS